MRVPASKSKTATPDSVPTATVVRGWPGPGGMIVDDQAWRVQRLVDQEGAAREVRVVGHHAGRIGIGARLQAPSLVGPDLAKRQVVSGDGSRLVPFQVESIVRRRRIGPVEDAGETDDLAILRETQVERRAPRASDLAGRLVRRGRIDDLNCLVRPAGVGEFTAVATEREGID